MGKLNSMYGTVLSGLIDESEEVEADTGTADEDDYIESMYGRVLRTMCVGDAFGEVSDISLSSLLLSLTLSSLSSRVPSLLSPLFLRYPLFFLLFLLSDLTPSSLTSLLSIISPSFLSAPLGFSVERGASKCHVSMCGQGGMLHHQPIGVFKVSMLMMMMMIF